ACVKVMYPPAGMIVPAGIWYFLRFVATSLRYQLPMSMGAAVAFFSSTQSPPAIPVLLERTSLMTTEPGLMPSSLAPGPPLTGALGRQPAAVLRTPFAAFGSIAISE